MKEIEEVADSIHDLIRSLRILKDNNPDRGRAIAICITEAEKLEAYYNWFVVLE